MNRYRCMKQPVCGSDAYLADWSTTQKGTCMQQPVCGSDTYLADSSPTQRGWCAADVTPPIIALGGGPGPFPSTYLHRQSHMRRCLVISLHYVLS